jgi:hypothetical protein
VCVCVCARMRLGSMIVQRLELQTERDGGTAGRGERQPEEVREEGAH